MKGYQFEKDQYVVIDPEELDQLRTEKDRSISVDAFVPQGSVDPVYFAGRAYYLVPDGKVGEKPYALLRQVMAEEQMYALAKVVISSREQVVLVRPMEELLTMSILEYAAEVKQPDEFADEVPAPSSNKEELKLTRMLVQALSRDKPELAQYRDEYFDKLRELIEAKVGGRELVVPPASEEPRIVNMMDALKASMQAVRVPKQTGASAKKKPSRTMAASVAMRKAAKPKRKRKSG